MKLSDFDFEYPEDLIATVPLEDRSASKMMVLDRGTRTVKHSFVRTLPDFLKSGDLLIFNDTRVFPARLLGKKDTGGKIDILLLKRVSIEPCVFQCITDQTAKLKTGAKLLFENDLTAKVVGRQGDSLLVEINDPCLIEAVGHVPIPPYIRSKRAKAGSEDLILDRSRYQTIFAKTGGSSAAPTAGLHFTENLLADLRKKGVDTAAVTLHVGLDTFSPVRVDKITDHKMHGEEYIIPEETAEKIDRTKKRGGKVVAVGTTSVRALESYFQSKGSADASKEAHSRTEMFIYPGYKFGIVDAILTNFHQPKSTLIMMVSAFAGKDFIFDSYREAIKERYRLFSYGDCMLIL